MTDLVTLLTPTGGRPEAFKLCEKYIRAQTYRGPIEWCVVYDMDPPPQCTAGQRLMRGPKAWRPNVNTQRPNCDLLLQMAKGEFMFWIEDDDYYNPKYIEDMLYFLQKYDAVGEANNRYFALQDRSYIEFRNTKHASLCSTAFRRVMLPVMDEAVNSGANPFFDCSFWARVLQENRNGLLVLNPRLNVGMKQLPGRMGIGAGHNNTKAQGFTHDPNFGVLRSWIGQDDLNDYIKLATGQKI